MKVPFAGSAPSCLVECSKSDWVGFITRGSGTAQREGLGGGGGGGGGGGAFPPPPPHFFARIKINLTKHTHTTSTVCCPVSGRYQYPDT